MRNKLGILCPIVASLLLAAISALSPFRLCAADEVPTSPSPTAAKAYLIMLKLVPRLYPEKAWTEADKEILQKHFSRLKTATEAGQVILAGRTDESGDKTFGIIVLTAPDEAAARVFMKEDPCVAGGLMTAELHPYTIALRAK